MALHHRPRGFVRPEVANVGFPSAFGELPQRNSDAGANFLNGHAWR